MSAPDVPETVRLFSRCLLSKWGFEDGDLLDWLYEHGKFPRDKVLIAVVRQKLLPAITQRLEVSEIGTCHNPIRADKVDGVDVTDEHYDPFNKTALTPEYVDVPGEEILRIAREVAATP